MTNLIITSILLVLLIVIIYKKNSINNKKVYLRLVVTLVILIILFCPLTKIISDKIYFKYIDYNYELVIKNVGQYNYDYYVHIYDNRINVIQKEEIVCFKAPCDSIVKDEYEIKFTIESMNKIYIYVSTLFEDKNSVSTKIIYNDIANTREVNIIKSLIFNDESYIKDDDISYEYKIITDSKYKTLLNDGGSHINIYYKINFSTKTITKYEDSYIGLEGYEYKGKIIYKKNIDINTNKRIKLLINNLIKKEDINDKNSYSPYIVELNGNSKEIYNSNSIKSLEDILEMIDKK